MLLSYRHEQVDSFLHLMKFSVSLCEVCKCCCFSSFITTFPANTFFTQLTCWCPNEEACEWASSQVKNNLWITLPSVHSRSSLLPWSLFYFDISICQLLLVRVVYSETTCSSWRETKRDNSCSQCGNSELREGSSSKNKAVNRWTTVGSPIILWQILCSAQKNQCVCVPPVRLCVDLRHILSWSLAAHAVSSFNVMHIPLSFPPAFKD